MSDQFLWILLKSNIYWPSEIFDNHTKENDNDYFEAKSNVNLLTIKLFMCDKILNIDKSNSQCWKSGYDSFNILTSQNIDLIDDTILNTYKVAISKAVSKYPQCFKDCEKLIPDINTLSTINTNNNCKRLNEDYSIESMNHSMTICNETLKRVKKRQNVLEWDDYFMSVAFLSSMRSKDPSTQVGACIVNEDKRIVGIGYNGFPRGCSDDELPWDRVSETGSELDTKYPYVCHAEVNAILNKNSSDVRGCSVSSCRTFFYDFIRYSKKTRFTLHCFRVMNVRK